MRIMLPAGSTRRPVVCEVGAARASRWWLMTTLHIHAPQPDRLFVRSGVCPDCKLRTRFIGWHTPWYGCNQTCLRCGREWSDGEWMALPFVPKSRQRNIEAAKRRWRRMRDAGIAAEYVPAPETVELPAFLRRDER